MKTNITVYPAPAVAPYKVAVDVRSTTAGIPKFDVFASGESDPLASVIHEMRVSPITLGDGLFLSESVSVATQQSDGRGCRTIHVPASAAVPLALALLMAIGNPYTETLIREIERKAEEAETDESLNGLPS